MTDEEPTAKVTLTAVYDKVQTLATAVAVLTEKLPSQSSQLSDHEKRIRSLETRMWVAVGAFGLLSFASPYLSKIFIP